MNVTLQDALNATNDEIGNYSTGVVDQTVKIRAINRSIEYIKRNLSIPGDEKKQTIWYTEDQIYYDINTDVDETLQLLDADPDQNTPGKSWNAASYPDILRTSGVRQKRQYGITNKNGTKQLVILGTNRTPPVTIDDISAVGNWTDEADASGLALDTDVQFDNNGSLAFDISNSSGVAALQNASVNLDIDSLKKKHGFVKLYTWLSSANIDSMAVKLYTDDSNYYTITATEADDGTDFTADEWIKVGFALDDAIATGTPTDTNITKIRIEWDLGSGFTTAVDFRLDYVFTCVPDKLELIYYSSYKGTDSTGVTQKQTLDTVTDILSISDHGEDLLEVIAQRAAIKLYPQLSGDKEGYMLLKQDFNENMKGFSKRWPRKRTQNNSLRTRIIR